MSAVSVYLNFKNQTEEAFDFYKSIFGTEYDGDGISRMGEFPANEGMPKLTEDQKNLVMHVSLPLIGDFHLMGSDVPDTMGNVQMGNNVNINLQPDTRAETVRLFEALSEDGEVTMPLAEQFWGDYFGACCDKFGVHWMLNCEEKA